VDFDSLGHVYIVPCNHCLSGTGLENICDFHISDLETTHRGCLRSNVIIHLYFTGSEYFVGIHGLWTHILEMIWMLSLHDLKLPLSGAVKSSSNTGDFNIKGHSRSDVMMHFIIWTALTRFLDYHWAYIIAIWITVLTLWGIFPVITLQLSCEIIKIYDMIYADTEPMGPCYILV